MWINCVVATTHDWSVGTHSNTSAAFVVSNTNVWTIIDHTKRPLQQIKNRKKNARTSDQSHSPQQQRRSLLTLLTLFPCRARRTHLTYANKEYYIIWTQVTRVAQIERTLQTSDCVSTVDATAHLPSPKRKERKNTQISISFFVRVRPRVYAVHSYSCTCVLDSVTDIFSLFAAQVNAMRACDNDKLLRTSH